jgi:Domain of unknown function (DUF6249)
VYLWNVGILIPLVAIVGAFVTAIVKALARSRVRELEIRERIAMIERGLVPSPESDPRKFDEFMSRLDARTLTADDRHSPGRYRRAALILIGIGVGLMLLIGVERPREGLGVGGFIACLGVAFFLASYLDGSSRRIDWRQPPAPGASYAPPRPTNPPDRGDASSTRP